jgi:hypothetical protein
MSAHSLCVKAYIGDRMFNKHVTFPEVPRKGDWVQVEGYTGCVQQITWSRYGGALVHLESDQSQAEPEIIAAGFVELKRRQ